MSPGLIGNNDLSAEVCIHIYTVYVIPILLYGVEVLFLSGPQPNALEVFHSGMIDQL